ncbi:MAG: CIA30 family protein [Wenzhouxiangella sp.]
MSNLLRCCSLGFAALCFFGAATAGERVLIDDFSSRNGVAMIGTEWRGFTDRVMGGRSDMQVGYRENGDQAVLHMRGQVRLDNNGGFIQARLPLHPNGSDFDASEFQGIAIRVRGAPGPYYIHLRTRHTWRPWQYYRAVIEVGPEWQDQLIPFSAFEPRAIRRDLDLNSLRTLGIVAYGEVFEAEIEVARIELVGR